MYNLGIDIGTSSIKVTLVDQFGIQQECHLQTTDADVKNTSHPEYHEQNVSKILHCLETCLDVFAKKVGTDKLNHVVNIAVCGQMHGCMLWNSPLGDTLLKCDKTSTLITWRDGRCDADFLQTLPKFNGKFLEDFNSCGTIADYIVAKLAQNTKLVMSYQNANSWGYFNLQTNQWDHSVLKLAKFPLNLLPEAVPPGTCVGNMTRPWHGICEGTRVYVALGDMQCSVLACRPKEKEAVMYVGTSSQISMTVDKDKCITACNDKEKSVPVCRVPFFKNQHLLTYASLNGGAVFGEYVRMLKAWTKSFIPNVTEEEIYARLVEDKSQGNVEETQTRMEFIPNLFGERHAPDMRATLRNINVQHFNAPDIGRAIAAGILRNLRSAFDDESHGFTHVWACGGVFAKNRLFREELNTVFGDKTVSLVQNIDAAYGAGISLCKNFT